MSFFQNLRLSNDETIRVSWEKDYMNVRVEQNGKQLAVFPNGRASLLYGQKFKTAKKLELSLNLDNNGLACWDNGKDLFSGLASGASDEFKTACNWLMGYGVLQVALTSILVLLADGDFDPIFSFGIGVFLGGVLIFLGYWAKNKSEKWPLVAGVGFLILIAVLGLVSGRRSVGFLIIVVGYQVLKGIQAGPLARDKPKKYDENAPLDADI